MDASDSTKNSHPDFDWLKPLGGTIEKSLLQLWQSYECLRARAEKGYRHRTISGSQGQNLTKRRIEAGDISEEGTQLRNFSHSPNETAYLLYQNGRALQLFSKYIEVKVMGVASLLEAAVYGIRSQNLLLLMTMMRGVLEHVGQFELSWKSLKFTTIPEDLNEASDLLIKCSVALSVALVGTRVNWEKLSRDDVPESLTRKDIEYKPEKHAADLTAPQVLKGIDLLEKRVSGSRVVYEILCEFCHPNAGVMLAFSKSGRALPDDRYGIHWMETELGLGAPIGFLEECARPLGRVFEVFAGGLIHFEELLEEYDTLRKPMRDLTQRVIRAMIAASKDLIWPYSECPCGSGRKVRFCCGAKLLSA